MKAGGWKVVRTRVIRLKNALRLRMARIPYYGQLDANDCGVACLRMTLEFLGHCAPYKELYSGVQVRPSGVTAAALIRTAEAYGLRAAAVHATRESLPSITRGAILHCRSGHYVVLDRVKRDGTVRVLDPRLGRRAILLADCCALFSGIAIVLWRADQPSSDHVTKWSALISPRRMWSRYRQVLPGTFFWTAVHVTSLGAAAAFIGTLGGRIAPPMMPLFIGCAALVLCGMRFSGLLILAAS